nr:hypothetical protein HK105_002044 [Polyrhizophydium stewartii]
MTDCAAAARNLVKAVPLGARLTALACVGVLASGLSAGPDSEPRVCLMPGELLDTPWTLLSAPFVHLSPLHLAANLLSLATLAPRHERALGTLASLWACMVLSLASGLLGACIALLSDELVSHGWARSCSAGLSGYLFALLAADSIEHREPRQLFGAVRIHAAAFPWAVLVAVQVLVPAASFVAHLGGLAAGFAFAYGLLAWAMPRGAWIVALESAPGIPN